MSHWDQHELRIELGPVLAGGAGRTSIIDGLFDQCMRDLSDPHLRAGAASVLADCLMLTPYTLDTEDPLSVDSASFTFPIHEPVNIQNTPLSGRIIA